jgi:hypothetical protein
MRYCTGRGAATPRQEEGMARKLFAAGVLSAIVLSTAQSNPARAEFSSSVEERTRCFVVERTEGNTTYATMRLMMRQTCQVSFRGRAGSMRIDQRPTGHLFIINNGALQNGFAYTPISNGGRDSFTITGERSGRLLSLVTRATTLVVTVEITPRENTATRTTPRGSAQSATRSPGAKPNEPPPNWVTSPAQ